MSSISSAGSILAALTMQNSTGFFATLNFKIDSGVFEHINSDWDLYKDFDETTAKEFDVVHGESVRSLGSGTNDLIAKDTDGEWATDHHTP
eukprot:9383634-Pyramimonas_sp.AAC.1